MSDEMPVERVSRFREHTNTNSSIRAPPDELWKDVGIETLLDRFNDENDTTPAVRSERQHPRHMMERSTTTMTTTTTKTTTTTTAARKASDAAASVATAEGTFGRFSRVFASVFGGVLGKRKAGHADAEPTSSNAAIASSNSSSSSSSSSNAEQALLDERKRAAEEAYHIAKAQGLLPAPKVFVRPGMTPRAWSADTAVAAATATAAAAATEAADGTPSRPRPRPPLTPRTPGSVARSPSKKDLSRQKKLSKRVSSLELKLASAKKDLASVLGNDCFPPLPPLPRLLDTSDAAALPLSPTTSSASASDRPSVSLPSQVLKKRKTTAVPDSTDAVLTNPNTSKPDVSEPEAGPLKHLPTTANKRLKRSSTRLTRSISRSAAKSPRRGRGRDEGGDGEGEEEVVVVRPGGDVPPVPVVPGGLGGRKEGVDDDGYGGLGHEIF